MQWGRLLGTDALRRVGAFAGELLSPNLNPAFLYKLWLAALETLAMSMLGTLLAVVGGLLLALPASKLHADDEARLRASTRLLLNALRSIPELMWASLLLVGGLLPAPWRSHCTPPACWAGCSRRP